MREKIVRPDRRHPDRRQSRPLTPTTSPQGIDWRSRRVHCWNLEPTCTEDRRKRCSAYFVEQNCWDLWAAEYFPPGRRPCCRPEEADCSLCPVAAAKFDGPISIYVAVPPRRGSGGAGSPGIDSGIRCTHFYIEKSTHAEDGDTDAKQALKCRRRAGVRLHGSYVSEVCTAHGFQECVFYGA